jgi:septin family protein
MKNLIAIVVLMISTAALAQTTDTCRDVLDSETICTFSDGSATVVWHPEGEYNSTHYTASQWLKEGPAIEAKARKTSDSVIEQEKNEAEQHEKDIAAYHEKMEKALEQSQADLAESKAASELTYAHGITNKKKCLAAGYAWTKQWGCTVKDGQ